MTTMTFTIDENGDIIALASPGADVILKAMGEVQTQRASHVEPDAFALRIAFHIIRSLTSDDTAVAEWTRHWRCLWRVNTSPVGGPILAARWTDREQAIAAEIEFLNNFFLEETL